MKHSGYLFIAVAALLLAGCKGGGKSPEGPVTRDFPQVQVPGAYTEQSEALSYMAGHYWDKFLSTGGGWLCDSTHIAGVDKVEIEQGLSNYLTILDMVPVSEARSGMARLFSEVEAMQEADTASNVYSEMAALVAKYAYDPNSPFRNEDYYQVYVSGLAASMLTDPSMVPSYEHDAQMCSLNAIGTPAADFVFRDINGRDGTLYSVKAQYTLLFFSNPGCHACKDIIEALTGSEKVHMLVDEGDLAVVNIYIDEDIAAWRDYQDIYPKWWYNGYDPSLKIRTDVIYNVRAIPSLYLLDSEKRVIMKDAPQDKVFRYLDNLIL